MTPWSIGFNTTGQRKLAMPSGISVQAASSSTGLTLILLSEKQVVVHLIEEVCQTLNTIFGYRYDSLKAIGDWVWPAVQEK